MPHLNTQTPTPSRARTLALAASALLALVPAAWEIGRAHV